MALGVLAAAEEAERLHDGFSDDGTGDDSDSDRGGCLVGDDKV